MPFAIDGVVLKINLCEEMTYIKGRKGCTGAALVFILTPQNKYITTMNWMSLSVLVIIILLL